MRGCERPGRLRPLTACLVAAGFLVASGCSEDDGLGKRYQVTGTVTYKGKPLEKGLINFLSTTPEGRPANGDIEGGSYKLTTQTSGDGALPGKYRVTIIAKEVDLSKVQERSQQRGGAMPDKKELATAHLRAKLLIPAKYESANTSGLEAEVKEQSNTFDFELTD